MLLDSVELLDHAHGPSSDLLVNEFDLVDHLYDLDHLNDLLLLGLRPVHVLLDCARLHHH